jgi:hypothetical protein
MGTVRPRGCGEGEGRATVNADSRVLIGGACGGAAGLSVSIALQLWSWWPLLGVPLALLVFCLNWRAMNHSGGQR